jgi:hypothetical protein
LATSSVIWTSAPRRSSRSFITSFQLFQYWRRFLCV